MTGGSTQQDNKGDWPVEMFGKVEKVKALASKEEIVHYARRRAVQNPVLPLSCWWLHRFLAGTHLVAFLAIVLIYFHSISIPSCFSSATKAHP